MRKKLQLFHVVYSDAGTGFLPRQKIAKYSSIIGCNSTTVVFRCAESEALADRCPEHKSRDSLRQNTGDIRTSQRLTAAMTHVC